MAGARDRPADTPTTAPSGLEGEGLDRRGFFRGAGRLALATAGLSAFPALLGPGGRGALLAPAAALAQAGPSPGRCVSVQLDTNDPLATFALAGTQMPSTGPNAIIFDDQSGSDISGLFASDPGAAPGGEVDLVAAFQVFSAVSHGAHANFRLVINDGQSRSAIVSCVVLNGQRGLGLAGPGPIQDAQTYHKFLGFGNFEPVFFPIDWQQAPLTVRLRRTAQGGAELAEVNGVAPDPPLFLGPDQVAANTRGVPTVELGCFSGAALANVEVSEFYSEYPCATNEAVLLPPIRTDGSSRFWLGWPVLIAIRVTDESGAVVDSLAPQLALEKLSPDAQQVTELVSSLSGPGTTMRFVRGSYAYLLSTHRSRLASGRRLTSGRYRLTISDPSFADVTAEFTLRR